MELCGAVGSVSLQLQWSETGLGAVGRLFLEYRQILGKQSSQKLRNKMSMTVTVNFILESESEPGNLMEP